MTLVKNQKTVVFWFLIYNKAHLVDTGAAQTYGRFDELSTFPDEYVAVYLKNVLYVLETSLFPRGK